MFVIQYESIPVVGGVNGTSSATAERRVDTSSDESPVALSSSALDRCRILGMSPSLARK